MTSLLLVCYMTWERLDGNNEDGRDRRTTTNRQRRTRYTRKRNRDLLVGRTLLLVVISVMELLLVDQRALSFVISRVVFVVLFVDASVLCVRVNRSAHQRQGLHQAHAERG